MSRDRTLKQQPARTTFDSFIQTYLIGFIGGNTALFIGHPAERLKVAAQIHLNIPTMQVIKPIISTIQLLYTGFSSCIYRQNIKLIYRSGYMSEVPHRIDDLKLNFVFASALKGLFASSIDTMFITPAENIKTWQMRNTVNKVSVSEAVSSIYRTRGFQGFLFGVTPTMTKSFPAWFYLFLGYHATKNKREQKGFLTTILWATIASIPITTLTNPLDVLKTQMQATANGKSSSMIAVAKNIYQKNGLFAFSKGFPFRLIHKALATATSYVILDTNKKLRNKM